VSQSASIIIQLSGKGAGELLSAQEMARGLRPLLVDTGKRVHGQAIKNVRAGAPVGSADPYMLSVRSGALWKSIAWSLLPEGQGFVVGAGGSGPARKYAAVHETGRGPMSRARGYFLIPLPAYLTKAGAAAQTGSGLKVWRLIDTYLKPIKGGAGSGFSLSQPKLNYQRVRSKALKAGGGIGEGRKKAPKSGPRPPGYVAFEKTTDKPFYLLLRTIGRLKPRPYITPAWEDTEKRSRERLTSTVAQLMGVDG
jgi:hypothetical protein